MVTFGQNELRGLPGVPSSQFNFVKLYDDVTQLELLYDVLPDCILFYK